MCRLARQVALAIIGLALFSLLLIVYLLTYIGDRYDRPSFRMRTRNKA